MIIVNYNVREFLKQALSSVCRARGSLEMEIIVVDNNSVDGSPDLVANEFPEVSLICNTTNLGFGAANNAAIRDSRGRYLLILNPDTIVQEDTLATLVHFLDRHPGAGAAGCKILNPDGTFAPESRRAFPTPEVAFYRMSGLSKLFPGSKRFGRYNMTFLPPDEASEVDALSGSCMMVRRAALMSSITPESAATRTADELSRTKPDRLFDEAFFMYGEDLDLCFRIQAAGWKIYYTPSTQIIHYKGESTRKGDLLYVRLFYGAMLHFAQKHFRQRSVVFRLALRLGIMGRAAASAAKRGMKAAVLPALEFIIVYLSVVIVAAVRFDDSPTALDARFLLTTPVLYAAATVVGIRLTGGYKRGRKRLRPVIAGLLTALIIVSALSFFIKAIAFSRFVVLVSLVPATVLLSAERLAGNRRRRSPVRALVVGDGLEAARLEKMVASHLRPPFSVVGYATLESNHSHPDLPVSQLGTVGQLRDIIRVWNIDEVIFATSGLQNRTVMSLMSTLGDLPVEFKTFIERGNYVIGKAKVDDLSVPLISTRDTYRSSSSGRLHEALQRSIALFGFIFFHFGKLISGSSGVRGGAAVEQRLKLLREVVSGRLSLIGWLPSDTDRPPDDWEVKPGAFSVSDAIPSPDPTSDEILSAWQVYLNNRSVSIDLEIVAKAVRRTFGQSRE